MGKRPQYVKNVVLQVHAVSVSSPAPNFTIDFSMKKEFTGT